MKFFTAPKRLVIGLCLIATFGQSLIYDGFRLDRALVFLVMVLATALTVLQIVRPQKADLRAAANLSSVPVFWIAAAAFGAYAIFRLFWGGA